MRIYLRNLNGLKFEKLAASEGFGYVGVSFGMALADFDRDGDWMPSSLQWKSLTNCTK